jgi:hypothetical protein
MPMSSVTTQTLMTENPKETMVLHPLSQTHVRSIVIVLVVVVITFTVAIRCASAVIGGMAQSVHRGL